VEQEREPWSCARSAPNLRKNRVLRHCDLMILLGKIIHTTMTEKAPKKIPSTAAKAIRRSAKVLV